MKQRLYIAPVTNVFLFGLTEKVCQLLFWMKRPWPQILHHPPILIRIYVSHVQGITIPTQIYQGKSGTIRATEWGEGGEQSGNYSRRRYLCWTLSFLPLSSFFTILHISYHYVNYKLLCLIEFVNLTVESTVFKTNIILCLRICSSYVCDSGYSFVSCAVQGYILSLCMFTFLPYPFCKDYSPPFCTSF